MNPNERVSTAIGLIGKRTAQLVKLEAELLAIIECDARNSSTRDGYPGGGNTGPRGNSELTPTESAAAQRMGRRPSDEYHRAVMGALDALERTIQTLGTLTSLPERVAKLQTVTTEDGNTNWCWVARQYGLPYDTDWDSHRTTDFAGYLTLPWSEPHPVCRWVYDYTRARHCLPSEAEMLNYLQRRGAA